MNKRTKEILSVIVALAIVSNGSVIKVLANENTSKAAHIDSMNKATSVLNKTNCANVDSNKVDMNELVTVMIEIDDNHELEKIKNKISKVGQVTFKREFLSLVKGISIECKRSLIADLNNIEGVVIAKESEVFNRAMASADAMTKAYNVWKNYGYKGQGIVVSIIDSGIDTRHKDMRISDPSKAKIKDIKYSDETYFTAKVPYGRNFAENNDYVKDLNPFTGEHGMHVAGIVAANGDGDDGFKGVAPEAQLLAMKVFGNNSPSCREDDIIAAIEDSVVHGADIINMSLTTQSNFNDPNSMFQKAIKKATEKGVIIVVAAGNDGVMGGKSPAEYPVRNDLNLKDTSILGNPANTLEAITVASFENNMKTNPVIYLEGAGLKEKLKYDFPSLSHGFTKDQIDTWADVVYLSREDLKNMKEDKKIDLDNKFILIEANSDIEKFSDEIFGVFRMGKIKGLMIYGELDVKDSYKYGFMNALSVVMVDKSTADRVKKLATKGLRLHISNEKEAVENVNGGSMSTFTSFGPTSDLEFKPDVTAPGGNIYSTLNDNRYGTMSGTSMASPHTAGAMALILQHINNSALDIPNNERVSFAKNTLLNTAEIIVDIDVSGNLPYSPRRQGSGLIQIDKAIRNNVIVTGNNGVGNISLKEIGYTTDFEVTLKNYGKEATSFEVDKTHVFTEKIVNGKGVFGEAIIDGGALVLDCNEITLMPGETKKIKAKLSLPVVLQKGIFVEGFVQFKSKDDKNPNLSIPYMGYFGDYTNEPIFYKVTGDKSKELPSTSLIYSSMGDDFEENGFISPNGDEYKDAVSPMISLLRNCRELIIDVVDKNDGTENVLRTIANKKDVRRLPLSNFLGSLFNLDSVWNGIIYDAASEKNIVVPDGQYYVRLRAKVSEVASEYQTMYLPVRVDTKAPSLEVLETKLIDGDDDSKCVEVKFKSEDGGVNSSGIDLSGMSLELMNDNKMYDLEGEPQDLGGNIYIAKFNLRSKSQDIKNLALSIRDKAGNKTTDVSDILFKNLKEDGYIISRDLTKTGEFELNARVRQGITNVLVNDKKFPVGNNGEISIKLDTKQGEQTLNIKLYDKDNKEVYSSTQKVTIDTVGPEITSLNYEKVKDIDDKKSIYRVWGSVKETENSFEELKLFINNSEVGIYKTGFFYKELEVFNLRGIDARLSDKAGNRYRKYIDLNEDQKKNESVTFENINTENMFIYEPIGISSDGYLEVKGKVSKETKKLYLNGEEVQLKEDGSFNKLMHFKQGITKFIVRTIDKDNNKNDSVSMVVYDDEAPELSTNLDSQRSSNGDVIVDGDELIIDGLIKDNTYGTKVTVNGDEVINTLSALNMNLPVGDVVFKERSFKHKIKLTSKETKVSIIAEDFKGNKTIKTYNVMKN